MGLVTAQEIIDHTPMGGNVDEDKYMFLVDDVETFVIEPILGTKLFEKIKTDFNEGGTNNLTGDYLEIFNKYLKPIIWHSVCGEYVKIGFVLIRNGGIYRHQPEDAQQAEVQEIDYVAKNQKGKADSFINRLEKYLCDKDIPEYDTQDEDYDIDPTQVNTIGGWFFGKSNMIDKDKFLE